MGGGELWSHKGERESRERRERREEKRESRENRERAETESMMVDACRCRVVCGVEHTVRVPVVRERERPRANVCVCADCIISGRRERTDQAGGTIAQPASKNGGT